MSHTPHELAEEFPGEVDKMHALKESNAHFAKLFDEYHAVNGTIHRAETDVEPMADEHQTELRKKAVATAATGTIATTGTGLTVAADVLLNNAAVLTSLAEKFPGTFGYVMQALQYLGWVV